MLRLILSVTVLPLPCVPLGFVKAVNPDSTWRSLSPKLCILNETCGDEECIKSRQALLNTASLRVISDLTVSLSDSYRFIHNELSLREGGATEEEQLLGLREMATSYSCCTSLSLTDTFGSICSKIVNPTFQ